MKKILCAVIACAIGTSALCLGGCSSKKSDDAGYTVETTSPDLVEGDFGFFVLNQDEIMITEYRGTDKNVIVPNTCNGYKVAVIGASVFSQKDIETVVIPDSVTEIQEYAFSSCYSLKTIKVSENLKLIGTNAFFNTPALEKIDFPATLEEIGVYAFCGSGLKSVTIPTNSALTSLTDYVFYQCRNLKEVTLPDTVTDIKETTFASCPNSIVIKAPSGSYAEQYAADNKFEFAVAE